MSAAVSAARRPAPLVKPATLQRADERSGRRMTLHRDDDRIEEKESHATCEPDCPNLASILPAVHTGTMGARPTAVSRHSECYFGAGVQLRRLCQPTARQRNGSTRPHRAVQPL